MSTTRPEPSQDTDVAGAQTEEPGARRRAGYLLRHARLWIGALILLVLAAIVAAFTLGAFTTSEASAGNTAATGSLSVSNENGKVIFSKTGMVPGDTAEGTVTIKNTGESTGSFKLNAGDPVDTGAGSALSGVLRLRIDELGSGDTVVKTPYPEGPFASQPSNLDLGKWAGGDAHRYKFTVTLPAGTGNSFQNSTTKVTYTWSAIAGT